jgi:hypothetical protein
VPRSAEEYGYRSGTILGGSGYLRVRVSPEKAMVDYVRTVEGAAEVVDTYEVMP